MVERLGVSVYDYAFLASGVVLIAVGWLAIRADPPQSVNATSAISAPGTRMLDTERAP